MKKNNLALENVKFEVASEILAMKIAIATSSSNKEELKKLLNEQNKLYIYDEKVINKVLDVYGSEIKKMVKDGEQSC